MEDKSFTIANRRLVLQILCNASKLAGSGSASCCYSLGKGINILGKLVIDGNSVYELDDECIRKKEKEEYEKKRKTVKQNNEKHK